MAFGLTNAPVTFQRLMDYVFAGLKWKTVLVYLNDVLVYSKTFEQHFEDLREAFERIRQAKIKLKSKKCHLMQRKLLYLGHVISENGNETDLKKTKAIANIE